MEGILGIEILTSLWDLNQPGNIIETFSFTHIGYVVPCQKYLGNRLSHMGEEAIPEADKPTLPNCCHSLGIPSALSSQMTLTNREEEPDLYSRKLLRFIPHIHSA